MYILNAFRLLLRYQHGWLITANKHLAACDGHISEKRRRGQLVHELAGRVGIVRSRQSEACLLVNQPADDAHRVIDTRLLLGCKPSWN